MSAPFCQPDLICSPLKICVKQWKQSTCWGPFWNQSPAGLRLEVPGGMWWSPHTRWKHRPKNSALSAGCHAYSTFCHPQSITDTGRDLENLMKELQSTAPTWPGLSEAVMTTVDLVT